MIKLKTLLAATVATGVLLTAAPAFAADGFGMENLQLRLRGIGILTKNGGGNTSIGGETEADDAFVPELDITYFFTKNIAAELILATSKHELSASDTSAGNLDLGETWILPPVLTLQYHFTPDSKFSPYVGAGINYTFTYGEDNGADTDKTEAGNGFGWALQAGADYWLDDHWGLNLDVKKVWVDVDATLNDGAVTGNVELDPWIIGTGVSYRF